MSRIDEEDIGHAADPVGSQFEQLGHVSRAAGRAVEQYQPAMRAGVRGHHERTELAAVETQELRSRQTKRMSERRGHRQVGVDKLRDVDDCDVSDLTSGLQLASQVILAVVFPTIDPLYVLCRCKLQGSVMLVGLGQLRPGRSSRY